MGNLGRWAPWYDRGEPVDYGGSTSYLMAADFLDGLDVEDWGCGCAAYRAYHRGGYLGVDGTASRWCDVLDDVVTRRSSTPGLLLRHVLEHNFDWQALLRNACSSATERLVIVTFVPDGRGELRGWARALGVPNLAVPHAVISERLAETGWDADRRTIDSDTAFGTETIWLARRAAPGRPAGQPV